MKKNFVALTIFLPLCLIAPTKMHAGWFDLFRPHASSVSTHQPAVTEDQVVFEVRLHPEEADFRKVRSIHEQDETVSEHYKRAFERKEQERLEKIAQKFRMLQSDAALHSSKKIIKSIRAKCEHTPIEKIDFDPAIPPAARKILSQLARNMFSEKNPVQSVVFSSEKNPVPTENTIAYCHETDTPGNRVILNRSYFPPDYAEWDDYFFRHIIGHEFTHALFQDPAMRWKIWRELQHTTPRGGHDKAVSDAFDDFKTFQEYRADLYPASQNLHAAICATRFACGEEDCQSGKICGQAAKFTRLRIAELRIMTKECLQPADKTDNLCQRYAEHIKRWEETV